MRLSELKATVDYLCELVAKTKAVDPRIVIKDNAQVYEIKDMFLKTCVYEETTYADDIDHVVMNINLSMRK